MKKFVSLLFGLTLCAIAHANPIASLLQRILPENGDASKFAWTISATEGADQFTLSCDGSTINVSGNN